MPSSTESYGVRRQSASAGAALGSRVATGLTPREMQVCLLLASGLRAKEIGAELGIDHRTVETHWLRVKERLKIPDIVRLAHLALARGWIKNFYAEEPNG